MASNITFAGNDGLTNNTTPVVMVTAPASGFVRQVKGWIINNADTVNATVTFQLVDGVNTRNLMTITLSPGDLLQASESNDLWVLDTTSKSIQVVLGGAVTTNQLPWAISWAESN